MDPPNLKAVLLIGGLSTRMGKPKALLPYRGSPLYHHGLAVLRAFTPSLYLSLRDDDQLSEYTDLPPGVRVLKDAYADIGPAAGLIAAHDADPDATWLALACDFPLADAAAFRQLLASHNRNPADRPATTFVHPDGNPEPLFSVWGPAALRALKRNALEGRKTGPCFTLRKVLGDNSRKLGKGEVVVPEGERAKVEGYVVPADERWLVNTNTPEQWESVLRGS